jgi:hypothetical protein
MILELPNEKIQDALINAGIPEEAIFLADEFYALFTPADIAARLAPEFTSILKQLNFDFVAERRDCDDFAIFASAVAKALHARATNAEAGLAFGEIWCGDLQHAFCFAIHHSPGPGTSVHFYEPQCGATVLSFSEIKLTPKQAASVWLAKA